MRRIPSRLVKQLLSSLVFGALTSVAVACVAPASDDGSDATQDAISGSLSANRACAVRDAYLAADVGDFSVVDPADLPANIKQDVEDLAGTGRFPSVVASFSVPKIGTVYLVEWVISDHGADVSDGGASVGERGELATQLLFWDAKGNVVLQAGAQGTWNGFGYPTSTGTANLTCSGQPATWDGGSPPVDGGYDGGGYYGYDASSGSDGGAADR